MDLFSLRLLLIPMNLNGNHWTLAAIDVPNGTITYYDSMGGSEDDATKIAAMLEDLKQYVAESSGVSIEEAEGCGSKVRAGVCSSLALCVQMPPVL